MIAVRKFSEHHLYSNLKHSLMNSICQWGEKVNILFFYTAWLMQLQPSVNKQKYPKCQLRMPPSTLPVCPSNPFVLCKLLKYTAQQLAPWKQHVSPVIILLVFAYAPPQATNMTQWHVNLVCMSLWSSPWITNDMLHARHRRSSLLINDWFCSFHLGHSQWSQWSVQLLWILSLRSSRVAWR